jgi:hypothetical protein
MFVVARTPAALFRQMRDQGHGLEELELVRRAYDLNISVYSARFEPDGTPFQVHGIGTASVMAQLGAPAYVVGAAIIHNALRSGDWGDGRGPGPTASRRARVRDAIGADAEGFLFDLYTVAGRPRAEVIADPALDSGERWRVLLRTADLLDKWDDGRIMYSGDGRSDRAYVAEHQAEVVVAARKLGGDEFADSLEAAFARVESEKIPESLLSARPYSTVVPPASYRRRLRTRVRAAAYRFAGRARGALRRRLRR